MKSLLALMILISTLSATASDFINVDKNSITELWTNTSTAEYYTVVHGPIAEFIFSQATPISADEISEVKHLRQETIDKTHYRKNGTWICSQYDDRNNFVNATLSILKKHTPRINGYYYKCFQKLGNN